MDRPSAEVIIFLEAARAHRDHADHIRRRGFAFNDAFRRERFEALAFKQQKQADKLEAHALAILSLFEKADSLTADIQTEITKARLMISEMKKSLVFD